MIVYSKKIVRFVNDIKLVIKEILTKEIRLRVHGDRFYDRAERCSYPIKIVVYNNKSMLGYFDPAFYELGFHESLMLSGKKQLLDIIRHEIAHYITHITYAGLAAAHGPEFRAFCQQMGWGDEVYSATTCLDGALAEMHSEESAVLRKVQKLMALSESSNRNEAEQAMIKSQQLLLKHNIEAKYIGGEDEEKIYLKRIMKQKKENAKMRAIATILATFFVSVVYSRAEDGIYLEILGTAVNIEIAEYVASVLDKEFENLWHQVKSVANLKGMVAKNSFFLGIAKGYCNKIQALKREYDPHVSKAVMVIEKQLIDARDMVYPRLSSCKSTGSHCAQSAALGEKMGRQLNINPALRNGSTTLHAYLT